MAVRWIFDPGVDVGTNGADIVNGQAGDEFAASRELAEWKRRAAAAWPGVAVRRVENGVKVFELTAR